MSTGRNARGTPPTTPDWRCISVAPETDGQHDFTYTSGLWRAFEHPEVSIFGLPSAIAVDVLGSVVARIREGVKLVEGHLVKDVLQHGFTLKVAGVASSESYDEYFGEGVRQAGGRVPMLVLLWPNKRGEFPKPGEPHPQVEAFEVLAAS